ncbi:MAG: Glucokinase [Phycisphaerae bacterium]|nr:Glucokinase [Phycisphaerae bacterium]
MAERLYCGVDLGGTNIKAGVVRAADRCQLSEVTLETGRELQPEVVVGKLIDAARQAVAKAGATLEQITGIGIGSPGPLSHKRGVVFQMANFKHWRHQPLVQAVSEATGRPTTLENDGNAAAWGEFWAGAGRDVDSLVMLTLGTGVGGGIVLDGRLIRGGRENGAELGHMIVQACGRPCSCGQSGCLETYASAWKLSLNFVEQLANGAESSLRASWQAGAQITSKQIAEAASAGDPLAQRIWNEACHYLAIGCVNIARICNPDRILLAGGLINAGEKLLLEPVRRQFAIEDWKLVCEGMELAPEIRFASLGPNAGVIGAAGAVELAIEEGTIKV